MATMKRTATTASALAVSLVLLACCSSKSNGPTATGGSLGSQGGSGGRASGGTSGPGETGGSLAGGSGGAAGGVGGAGSGGSTSRGTGGAGVGGGRGGASSTSSTASGRGGRSTGGSATWPSVGGRSGTGGSGTGGSGGSAGTVVASGGTGTGGLGKGGATGRVDAGSGGATESIHYYGRWNRLADRAITVNSGSHVVAQFSGSAVSAKFDTSLNQTPTPTLAWRIDQGDWQEGELAASLPLATGVSAGTHEVTLMVRGLNENQNRWSPPLVSSITFLGFDVTGGEVQPSARPQRPTIEFLGDSITEGVALWSSYKGQSTACWRTDGRRAYPSQTAQLLAAEWRQVGFGRQGLLIEGNGGVPRANDAFNWIYQGVPRDDWQPDLVVINQGTNDGSASATAFRSAYATFIGTILAAYPSAKLAAMRPFNGAHAAEIKAEVDARRAAGTMRVNYVDTSGWLASGDFTDGIHPNEQGSQKAASALATAITTIGLP
jgi:lysophospholipase L1-like esterase